METTIMPKPSVTAIMVIVIASLAGLLPADLTTACCWGSDQKSVTPVITLDVQNEPLQSVLKKISKTTRWEIKVPDNWLEKPVTQALNKATLEEGLRAVLKGAGIDDLLLLHDENTKVVTLFDTEGPQKQAAGRPPARANAQQPAVSTTPQQDPILERARRAAESGSSRGVRRGRRNAQRDEP